MKPFRIAMLLLALAAAAAGVGFWLASRTPSLGKAGGPADTDAEEFDFPRSQLEFARASRASAVSPTHGSRGSGEPSATVSPSLVQRMVLNGEGAKLTRQQVETFLGQTGRSAHSLIAARWLLGDDAFVFEAAERFPQDPVVQLAMLQTELPAEARWDWIDALIEAEPDNALGHYAAAREHFRAGEHEEAIAELLGASAASMFDDHGEELVASLAAAYRSAGHDPQSAEFLARLTSPIVAGGVLQDFSGSIVKPLKQQADLALESGNPELAQRLLAYGMDLALDLSAPSKNGPAPAMVSEMMGFAVERRILSSLDLDALVPGETAVTVGQRLEQIGKRSDAIRAAAQDVTDLLLAATPADQAIYIQKFLAEGEMRALEWLGQKYPAAVRRSSTTRQ